MNSTAPSSSRPKVHIILKRHEEATSNVSCEAKQGSIDIRTISDIDPEEFAAGDKRIVVGDYLPCGLTRVANERASRKLGAPLENVEFLCCTTATRAVQTLQGMLPHIELGPGCPRDENGQPILHCDSRILEATNWPQDQSATRWQKDGRTYTSYYELEGGKGPDAGHVLGVSKVDLTNTDWRQEDDPKEALRHCPTFEEIEERVAEWRRDLFERASRTTNEGTARFIVVSHGGILSFILSEWRCLYKRKDLDSFWEWKGSGFLSNGEAVVFEFQPDGTLTEVPRDPYYEKVFGDSYKTFGEEPLVYKNPDGSEVDQKQGHKDFIRDTAEEVVAVMETQEGLLDKMTAWLQNK
ncbi:hypothetical protein BHE90_016728 [Fusarium euwallaceae]|uniref:Uncharacterized protein n=3 Tax=Fusarium solani species complex TaxID=232080 RepID=A0A3M2R8N6_9HYPO|nr:hypothetical protein CDV36_015642 [Fusarium kuroshium]RSL97795.1 hypothetical protein CEP52_010705 [Fusarium oligoseptatum]RTE68899.1 hypothetical protein BHE90_016728 [Fusarium euwallaceae]